MASLPFDQCDETEMKGRSAAEAFNPPRRTKKRAHSQVLEEQDSIGCLPAFASTTGRQLEITDLEQNDASNDDEPTGKNDSSSPADTIMQYIGDSDIQTDEEEVALSVQSDSHDKQSQDSLSKRQLRDDVVMMGVIAKGEQA